MCREAYHSVKISFSGCSTLTGLDFQDFQKLDYQDLKWSLIQELCYYQGRPFSLCKKAVLLLPESWSWRKGTRIARRPYTLRLRLDNLLVFLCFLQQGHASLTFILDYRV
ncbi:hypothetical protein EZV62_018707 [Acer yangbiense]|uniref:Uncharacterized protein n=1 Tax=Acer yangbiense TaxID=1000413 RepID=A0A5C7HKG8_9ROSI|nr:hypothetical protein EZV62_018707 [Acer yangbiense]